MFKEEIKVKVIKCVIHCANSPVMLQDEINKWLGCQPESTIIYGIDYQSIAAKPQFGANEYSALIVFGPI